MKGFKFQREYKRKIERLDYLKYCIKELEDSLRRQGSSELTGIDRELIKDYLYDMQGEYNNLKKIGNNNLTI